MDDFINTVQGWASWLTDRWAVSEPPPYWMILTALALIFVVVLVRPVWMTARHAVTIVHEMGHVVMAWMWGRRIQGIRLHSDTSGLAITAGHPRGLGVLMTYISGYTAPSVLGMGMVWASFAGFSGVALTLVVLMFLLAFLLVRNLFGFLVVILALASSTYTLWTGNAQAITAFTFILGMSMAIAGVRAVMDLHQVHSHGEGQDSDASMAAQHSLFPAAFWIWAFGVVNGICAAQAVLVVGFSVFE